MGLFDFIGDLLGVDDDNRADQAFWDLRKLQRQHDYKVQDDTTAFERQLQLTDINEQFQREMFESNNREYDRRLQEEREYDAPRAQIERAAAAGINPSAAIGSGVASDNTFSPPTSVGTPSSSTPVVNPLGSTPSTGFGSNGASLIGAFASVFKSITSGIKDVSERNRIEKLVTQEFESLQLDNQLKSITKYVQDNIKDTKIQQEVWELNNKKVKNLLDGQLFNESVQRELKEESERIYMNVQREYGIQAATNLRLRNENFNKILELQVDNMRADTFKKFSEGELAKSVKTLNDDAHILNQPETESAKKLFANKDAMEQKWQNIVNDLRNHGKITEQQYQEACKQIEELSEYNQLPWWMKRSKNFVDWLGGVASNAPVSAHKIIK